MIRIYAHTENEEQAEACYGAFLTGTIPQSGWILTEGAHLYLLDRKPAIPEGEGLAVSEGPVDFISTTLPLQKPVPPTEPISPAAAFLQEAPLPPVRA